MCKSLSIFSMRDISRKLIESCHHMIEFFMVSLHPPYLTIESIHCRTRKCDSCSCHIDPIIGIFLFRASLFILPSLISASFVLHSLRDTSHSRRVWILRWWVRGRNMTADGSRESYGHRSSHQGFPCSTLSDNETWCTQDRSSTGSHSRTPSYLYLRGKFSYFLHLLSVYSLYICKICPTRLW